MKRWLPLIAICLLGATFSSVVTQYLDIGTFRFSYAPLDTNTLVVSPPSDQYAGTCSGSHCATLVSFANPHATSVMDVLVDGNLTALGTLIGSVNALGASTSDALAADQNDYAPPFCSTTGLWMLSATGAPRAITGISASTCVPQTLSKVITLVNTGAFDITIRDDSGSSLAANRVLLRADFVLKQGYSLQLFYDPLVSKFRPVGVDLNDPGASGSGNSVEVSIALADAGYYSTTVTGQAWVAAGSEIVCNSFGTTADGLTPEAIAVGELTATVYNRVAGTGFDMMVYSPHGLTGTVRFHCLGV